MVAEVLLHELEVGWVALDPVSLDHRDTPAPCGGRASDQPRTPIRSRLGCRILIASGEDALHEPDPLHGEAGSREARGHIQAAGGQDVPVLGTSADGRPLVARLRSDATMDRLVQHHSPAWRAPGVGILHEPELAALLADRGVAQFRYNSQVDEVRRVVAGRGCNAACLIPAAGREPIEVIAPNLEEMPPKSTSFYPELLTDLVPSPLRRALARPRGGRGA